MISAIVNNYRHRAREKRRQVFLASFMVDDKTRILDLGSHDGSAVHALLDGIPYNSKNIFIADIDAEVVNAGAKAYGFTTVVIPENGKVPFQDKYFDIVFCSSVIEHVTVPKGSIYSIHSEGEFRRAAYRHQQEFASEICRLGGGYFVQTPNRWFLFESHIWLPFVGYLPRKLQMFTIKFFNKFWIKTTSPDFCLLDKLEFSALFPEAEVVAERSIGMVKSWMAIKRK